MDKMITLEEFKGLICNTWSKHKDFGNFFNERSDKNAQPETFLESTGFNCCRDLTQQIARDLEKVEFDTENTEWKKDEGFGEFKFLTGFNVAPNGMPYLGVCSGGDWEMPLFYIIYFDGKKLRAYIPKRGNTYNTDTKMAYGNDEEADNKNANKRFGDDDYRDAKPNTESILSEIDNVVWEFGVPLVGFKDIDWDVVEKIANEQFKDDKPIGVVQEIKMYEKIIYDVISVEDELREVHNLTLDLMYGVMTLKRELNSNSLERAKLLRDEVLENLHTRLDKVVAGLEK